MHRSGTTLVAKLISACNVWMGYDFNANYESLFFVKINKRLFRKQGEYWHRCEKTLVNTEDNIVLENWKKEIERIVRSQIWFRHFGLHWIGYVIRSEILQKRMAWGWKDPRTTLLFPLWKRIYPNLQTIGVIRNPQDVCISLYYRERHRYEAKTKQRRNDLAFEFPLSRNFELWKLYTQRVIEIAQEYPTSSIVLRYEELANENSLRHLRSFVGNSCDVNDLASLVSYRRNPYEDPPGLEQLKQTLASDPLVSDLGY